MSAPVPFGLIWVSNWVGIGSGGIGDSWVWGWGLGLDNYISRGNIAKVLFLLNIIKVRIYCMYFQKVVVDLSLNLEEVFPVVLSQFLRCEMKAK